MTRFELARAIASEGGQVESFSVREPTAKEVLEAEKHLSGQGGFGVFRGYQMAIVGAVSGLAAEVVAELPVSVLLRAFAVIDGYMSAGLDLPAVAAPECEIVLDPPVQCGTVTYPVLSLQEPTAGDVRFAENGLGNRSDPAELRAYQLRLVTRVTKMPHAAALGLPISKLNAAAAYLQGFIVAGRETGAS